MGEGKNTEERRKGWEERGDVGGGENSEEQGSKDEPLGIPSPLGVKLKKGLCCCVNMGKGLVFLEFISK